MSTMSLEAARKFLSFVQLSPTPFHAVRQAALRLEESGFKIVKECDEWDLNIGAGKFYYIRNQTSLIAFTIPKNWTTGAGLSIVATHVDSPNLRIRPLSKKLKEGYLQVGVETYGGGIWHTWFDRDLSVAGRVILSGTKSSAATPSFESRLIDLQRPILRIPSLAIHLDRTVNEAFKLNQETDLTPILGQAAVVLNNPMTSNQTAAASIQQDKTDSKSPKASEQRHHSELISAILQTEANLKEEDIHDFDLQLYDMQPPSLGGIRDEFILSARLDNLLSSYCAIESIIKTGAGSGANVNVAALFNHEEIGSVSSTGAESSLLPTLISRLSPAAAAQSRSLSKSFLISADMSHAVHPNYTNKHQDEHKPKMNGGVVIKMNAKQRYASDSVSSFLVRKMVEERGGQVQEFEVRNDSACGSTVGPMLSKLGVRTVDVGLAQLSMHSVREMCGSHDVQAYLDLFDEFYESFSNHDSQLTLQ